MKKVIITCLLLGFSLFLFSVNKVNAQEDGNINYTADFSKGLPSDWKLYDKCAKSEVSKTNGNGNVTITHSGNGAEGQYHGALYQINPEEFDIVSDFTIEMTFKVNSYLNETRWIGIMYHTNLDAENNLTGYMMNYRVKGKSAQSTISINSGVADFNDSLEVENTGISLEDNNYHTMKLVCSGTNVTHYMDNKAIISYDYKDYSTRLSKVQSNGGFALIVNKMSITISSLKITGKEVMEKELDTTITSTYNPTDYFVGELSVITKINSKSDLNDMIVDNVKPATAIIYVDENMNASSDDGTSLDISIKKVYYDYLYQRIIPAFYIKSDVVATKFIDYYKENIALMDAFVISDNPAIVKQIRSELYYLRGIIDYSNETIDMVNWKNVVFESNKAMANVVILNPKDATYEAVRYIQARFKTVWVSNDELSEIVLKQQVVNEVYGIIYSDFRFVYDSISSYTNTSLLMNRIPYNIAHRGMVFTKPENSLEGYIESYNRGATHIEIDIRLTKDNQIVVMHDETIDRTTNGSGQVVDLTLAQIKQYKIDSYLDRAIPNSNDHANIPSLEEVFKEFKDKDIVFVVEIKSYEKELIEQLKVLIEKYDFADNMVVISFHSGQLVNMKNILPEIPTAILWNVNEDVFPETLLSIATLNCGFDGGTWAAGDSHLRKLAVRGYSSWMWTYQREENIVNGFKAGVLGITNNEPNLLADYAIRIEFDDEEIVATNDNYSTVLGTIVKYEAQYNEKKVISIAKKQEFNVYAYVIYKYTYTNNGFSYVVFSDKVLVVTQSLKDDIEYAEDILKKDINDITIEEMEFLEDFALISDELESNKVSKIDTHLLKQKLEEIKEEMNNNDSNEQPTPGQGEGKDEVTPNPDDGNGSNENQGENENPKDNVTTNPDLNYPDIEDDELGDNPNNNEENNLNQNQQTESDDEDNDKIIAIVVVVFAVLFVLGIVAVFLKRR